MRLDFFMLADGASAAEGKAYIHGGAITRAYPPSMPSPPMLLSAVIRLLADPEDLDGTTHRISIEWRRPNATSWVPTAETDVPIEQPPEGVREGEEQGVLIVANMLVAFDVPGSHEIRLLLDNSTIGTKRFFVVPLDDPLHPASTSADRPRS